MGQWTPRKVVARAREVLRTEGSRVLLMKVLGETVYRRVVVVGARLDVPFPQPPASPLQVAWLQHDGVPAFCRAFPQADAGETLRRLRAGHRCCVGRVGGEPAGFVWIATGSAWIEYMDFELPLAEGEIYFYNSYVLPAFRGRGFGPLCTYHALHEYRDAGYTFVLAVAVPDSVPALRQMEKLRACPLGTLGYFQVGRKKRHFFRPTPAHQAVRYWDRVSDTFKRTPHYLHPLLAQIKRREHLRLLNRWGGVPAGGCVLKTDLFEEAMGEDGFLADMAPAGGLVVGMDVARSIVEDARRAAGGEGAFVVADARRLPFAAGAFDLIVSPSTLDHFANDADLGRSLRELRRTLQAAGRLVVTLDNRQNVFDPLLRLANALGLVPYHLGRSYRVDELRGELRAAGLQVLDTTAILHNPRLVAVGAVAVAARLGQPALRVVGRLLDAAQRLEQTRLRYRSGSFVAALATPARGDEP